MSENNSVILAFDSAIGGGSISLFKGGVSIAERSGTDSVSRAEELLETISDLLSEARIAPNGIDIIAVSIGPGSYTGLRIGIATALGLKNSTRARLIGISSLEAMAFASAVDGEVTAAVPFGKNDVAWQRFSRDAGRVSVIGDAKADSVEAFRDAVANEHLIIHPTLLDFVAELAAKVEMSILSRAIAQAARSGLGSGTIAPLYLRNARLGPAGVL